VERKQAPTQKAVRKPRERGGKKLTKRLGRPRTKEVQLEHADASRKEKESQAGGKKKEGRTIRRSP